MSKRAKGLRIMKALILAAGLGSRLSPITDKVPKALVPVNGKPIILKQIENLYENNIFDITIISGYKANVLQKTVLRRFPEVTIIESVDYATTNNMYSAYLGLKATGTTDLLMMNADVFFDASVITDLLLLEHSNAIVTDIGNYNEESMKVVEKSGRLIAISKSISQKEALGSSIDVYKFDATGAKAFYNKCREYIVDKQEVTKWSEVALNDILGEMVFKACPLNGRWFEIDTLEDLRSAEALFAE